MKIYIDKDSNSLISEPTFKSTVDTLTFKRGDATRLDIAFVTGNTALSATNDKRITFGVKEAGKYDGVFVTSVSAYTASGTEYIMVPSFNTTTLNALLSSGDGNSNNDIAAVTLMGEITWSEDSGSTWRSTNTFNVVVNNDVIKQNEGTALQNPTPEAWLASTLPTLDIYSPLLRTAAPVSYWPNDVVYDGMSLYETLIQVSGDPNQFSTDGGTTAPNPGIWSYMYHDTVKWVFEYWVDGSITLSDEAAAGPSTVNPGAAVWTAGSVIETANDFTAGSIGQVAIVDEAVTDTTDAYICVRESPVRWKLIS